jgi:tRNA nucleotidyltransferase (CCA-adding enzyme)
MADNSAAPPVPEPIRELAGAVAARGGRAYLVGGGVRDHLMGLPLKDWDVEVFGVEPDELRGALARRGSVNAVGKAFGVYKWTPRGWRRSDPEAEVDVSVPRRDSKVGPGHRGIAVEGDPTMSIEEAARRRDLTINAMMWDIVGETLVDPHAGAADLAAGVLRAVDRDTFLEDPLRALRVVQFAARLGFRPDDALVALCAEAKLDELPAERIQAEWGKLLLKGRDLPLGLEVARLARIDARVFPDVAGLRNDGALDRLARGPRDAIAPEGRQWAVMLAAWLAGAGIEAATATLDRLGMHTVKGYPVRDRVLAAVAELEAPTGTDAELRHLSTRAELRLLLTVRAAVEDRDLALVLERAEALGIAEERPAPLLLGRHLKELGVAPGPAMGRLLAEVYRLQLDGAVATVDDAIAVARAQLGGSWSS